MNTGRSDRWIGRAGFACGLATVAAVMVAARVPDQPHDLGLDLSVVPAPSTALTVKPSGPLVTIAGMRAGERSGGGSGNATLINPTSETQRIRLRAIPSSHALDRALSVEITVAGRRLYSGSLGGLRGATRASVDLPSGNGIPLHARVWLAAGATGWRGRIEDVDLAFDASPVTAR